MTSFLRIASVALALGTASMGLAACATAGPDPYAVTAEAPLTPTDTYAQFGWEDGFYDWPYTYSYLGWPRYGFYRGGLHGHFHGFHGAGHGSGHRR